MVTRKKVPSLKSGESQSFHSTANAKTSPISSRPFRARQLRVSRTTSEIPIARHQ